MTITNVQGLRNWRRPQLCRRGLLQTTAAAALTAPWSGSSMFGGNKVSADSAVDADTMTLGFSTYGMKSLKTENAIQQIDRIGFDAVELTVWPEWDASPEKMSRDRRRDVRSLLIDRNLKLTSLMEHVAPSAKDSVRAEHLDRLRGVFQLASDLGGDQKPLVQTVLGGGKWEESKNLLRDRVGEWLEIAANHETVLAVKPHRGGVMSQPSEAVWLINQLGQPEFLRIVYDYSHYAFRDLTIEDTVKTALPWIAHVAVKDPVQQNGRIVFRLPGEAGTIPYDKLLRLLFAGGYRGDISCEVSGMVWNKPGYDPVAAAQRSYAALSAAFELAMITRPSRESV